MKIYNSTTIAKNYKGSAIAIGNFDGIHKGHQKVFKEPKKFLVRKLLKYYSRRNPNQWGLKMDLNKMLKDGGYSRFCDHDITDQMLEHWLSITEKKKKILQNHKFSDLSSEWNSKILWFSQ